MNRLAAPLLVVSCCWVAVASDIPPPRPVDVAALVGQLGSDSFAERESASRRLSTLSVDAPPPELLEALKSPNAEIQDRARRAIFALKEHIVRERERVVLSRLPRVERFAKRGQVDLYVAATAATKLKAKDDRLWLPALEISGRAATKAGLKGDFLPNGPLWTKDFPAYRKNVIHDKMTRTEGVFTRGEKDYFVFRGAVLAAGVDEPHSFEGLIVSRRAVHVRKSLSNSLVIVTGDVIVRESLGKTAVICDGNVHVGLGMGSCFVIARGDVTVEGASNLNTVIAGGKVTLKNPITQTEASKLQYDMEDRVLSNATRPLGFITFFELSTVGIEVSAVDKAVKVAAIERGKPFDHAGVWVGDVITEVNGMRPDSAESLRRLLRDALAIGDAAVKLQRGEKTVTVKVALPE
jgi:hypothetical protein